MKNCSATMGNQTYKKYRGKGKHALRKWLPERVVWAIRYKYQVELTPNTTSAHKKLYTRVEQNHKFKQNKQ